MSGKDQFQTMRVRTIDDSTLSRLFRDMLDQIVEGDYAEAKSAANRCDAELAACPITWWSMIMADDQTRKAYSRWMADHAKEAADRSVTLTLTSGDVGLLIDLIRDYVLSAND